MTNNCRERVTGDYSFRLRKSPRKPTQKDGAEYNSHHKETNGAANELSGALAGCCALGLNMRDLERCCGKRRVGERKDPPI
jgi:hypothetical protein